MVKPFNTVESYAIENKFGYTGLIVKYDKSSKQYSFEDPDIVFSCGYSNFDSTAAKQLLELVEQIEAEKRGV